ncbi:hypothetical protein [Wenyingzhuangia sp. IMCC45467]
MNSIVKQVLAGTVLGLLVSTLGSFIFVLILLPTNDLQDTFNKLLTSGLLTKIITLGTLPNAIVFHLLIKSKRDYMARGVLMAVILLAVLFAILKIS